MNILIVDDAAVARRVLRLLLEAKSHCVIEAVDGREALDILGREEVDGVISDILMPNMDGFRLCLEIRKHEKLRRLPFIFFTSTYTSTHDRHLARMIGADDFLLKSASAETIIGALERAREANHNSPKLPAQVDESEALKLYNQALVNKLEKRNVELNEALLRIIEMNANLERRVAERTADLTRALSEVKELTGLLPICSYCKRVRDDRNYWSSVESYVTLHTKAHFNHSVCPDCAAMHIRPMLETLETDLDLSLAPEK